MDVGTFVLSSLITVAIDEILKRAALPEVAVHQIYEVF